MKILFLDIDGVLNSERYVKSHQKAGVVIDETKMTLLKAIIEKTGALIVLTSSWREHWNRESELCDSSGIEINEIFGKFALSVFDKTTDERMPREQQIRSYLDSLPRIDSFAIVDDMYLSAEFIGNRFVRTSCFKDGLTERDAEAIIDILNRK